MLTCASVYHLIVFSWLVQTKTLFGNGVWLCGNGAPSGIIRGILSDHVLQPPTPTTLRGTLMMCTKPRTTSCHHIANRAPGRMYTLYYGVRSKSNNVIQASPYPEPVYTGWSSVHWNATG